MGRRLSGLVSIAACALVVCASGAAGAAGQRATSSRAARALATARAAFAQASHGRDATMGLRDLALYRRELSVKDARRASALLGRPTNTEQVWCTVVCLHWTMSGDDAPPLRDANGNGLPDQVETTMSVLENVWQKEIVEFGFRPPKSDLDVADHGPDGRLDVYLQNIADEVLGYCAPEPDFRSWNVPGYCVLDDDYSLAQIGAPSLGGLQELQLTVAHEFFHAVQFGYDYGEDQWFMEGTAVWMEDEVYDTINEPYTYLLDSPLVHPEIPVDLVSAGQLYQYGAWIFWRFLEEFFSTPDHPRDPAVIRRVWELADGTIGAPDFYSLAAADALAREHGSSLRTAFAAFGVVNSAPRSFYQEGRNYPSSPLSRTFTLTPKRAATGGQQLSLDHMTNGHVAFLPGAGVRSGATLTLHLDLPEVTRGSAATVLTVSKSGALTARPVALDLAGDASVRIAFARSAVSRVILVLTNAGGRYTCNQRTSFSCEGRPLDDNLRFAFSARLS